MEPLIGAAAQPAPADLIKNSTTATFMADVIDASHDQAGHRRFLGALVRPLQDSWARRWRRRCARREGAVRMVKINIDKNQELAQQMRIQSIPAVYAFKDGPPGGRLRRRAARQPGEELRPAPLAPAPGRRAPRRSRKRWSMAKEALAAGDTGRAANIFTQVLQHEPDNLEALAGLARSLIAPGRARQARGRRSTARRRRAPPMPRSRRRAPRSSSPRPASKAKGALGELEARVERDPNDFEARYELASALFAAGEREAAIDELLEIVRRNRAWNEEAARKQLVKFFEAMGPTDPLTVAARRRLSSILFS